MAIETDLPEDAEVLVSRSAEFNRELWLGDSTRSWRVDLRSPELKAALAEMR